MDVKRYTSEADARIRPHVRKTPLEYSWALSRMMNGEVFLKLENLQHTGSFKFRGAMNKLLSLTAEERKHGVITASTGNHGLAVARGLQQLGLKGRICLPENSQRKKIEMLKHYGIQLLFHGSNCVEAEALARKEAERTGAVYISPYNDREVTAGQGTIGVELLRQKDTWDAVYVTVGGGGLISGIAGFMKETQNSVRVIGCQPRNSAVMWASVQAGRIVEAEESPTLSDGSAGLIEAGAITFELCRRYVDEWILVEEEEIRAAMKLIFEEHRLVIEGAAGVAVAAFLKNASSSPPGRSAIVICGGNVDIDTFKDLVF